MNFCPTSMHTYSNPYPTPNPYTTPNPYMYPPNVPSYPPYMPVAPPPPLLPDTNGGEDENTKHAPTPAAYTVPPYYLYPPLSPYPGTGCGSFYPPYMGAVSYHPSFQYPPTAIQTTPCANDPFARCDNPCNEPETGCYDDDLFAPPHDANICHTESSHTHTTVDSCSSGVQTTPVHDHCDHDHPHHDHPHHGHPHHGHCDPHPQECSTPARPANITCVYHDEDHATLPKEAYILRIPRNKHCSAYVYPKPE